MHDPPEQVRQFVMLLDEKKQTFFTFFYSFFQGVNALGHVGRGTGATQARRRVVHWPDLPSREPEQEKDEEFYRKGPRTPPPLNSRYAMLAATVVTLGRIS
jgi:hypothetical protein